MKLGFSKEGELATVVILLAGCSLNERDEVTLCRVLSQAECNCASWAPAWGLQGGTGFARRRLGDPKPAAVGKRCGNWTIR